ncbi:TonB family protein [Luteimonas sp. MC1782]|nr:TonB family protein [Luteimonas sp. MC1782]
MWQLILVALAAAGTGCSGDRSGCSTSSGARLVQLATAGDMSQARQLGLKGETSIEVLVGVQGGGGYLAEAKVARSSGAPILDRAAMYAVRYSIFEPASCDDVPVPGKVVVEVALP